VLVSLDIIGKVVSLPNLSEISNCYVIQGFDHDFDGGNSPEGKSIQDTWNNQVNAGMSTEAFYVRVISFYSSDIDWLSPRPKLCYEPSHSSYTSLLSPYAPKKRLSPKWRKLLVKWYMPNPTCPRDEPF
jgi:hypothetical protein